MEKLNACYRIQVAYSVESQLDAEVEDGDGERVKGEEGEEMRRRWNKKRRKRGKGSGGVEKWGEEGREKRRRENQQRKQYKGENE